MAYPLPFAEWLSNVATVAGFRNAEQLMAEAPRNWVGDYESGRSPAAAWAAANP